ncbi:MAG: hypothetical protein DBX59_04785 [Bacillota bacterium]|nr:MAG: hypothetical protein DBX59_04785 [Bacillota bacterium]
MKKLLYVLLTLMLACAVGAAACKPEEPATEITISISGAAERTLVEGQTLKLEAVTNSEQSVTWSSSSDENATVSADGLVTAVKEGQAIITAGVEGKNAACSIVVQRDITLVDAYWIGFEGGKMEEIVEKGNTFPLKAALYLGNSGVVDGAVLSYASENEAVAAVDAQGVVTAVAAGKTNIVVSYAPAAGDTVPAPDAAVFTVTVPRNLSFAINYEQKDLALAANRNDREVTLEATVKEDGNAITDTENIVWTSSDPEIATVDQNGKVSARSEGEVTITASYDIGSVSCEVAVWTDYIATADDFLAMFEKTDWTKGWFKMTADIDIPNPPDKDPGYSDVTYAAACPLFTGVFDGGNHKLSNVYSRIFMGMNGGTVRNLEISGQSGYWAGLFGDFFTDGLVENVTATIEFTKTEATNNTHWWWKRATGGLFNFASGGTFRNVTVYANIPDDIDTSAAGGYSTVAGMSAFGKSDGAGSVFEECYVYSNDLSIQFAALAQPTQFIDCSGAVEGWYVDYKVEHYAPNAAETAFELKETQTLKGLYNKTVTAEPIEMSGDVFFSPDYGENVLSGIATPDGKLVLKCYYTFDDVEVLPVGETEIELSAQSADDNHSVKLSATAKRGGEPVDNAVFIWTVDDESIASVDQEGNITGKKGGKTYVRANYLGAACVFEVTVYTRYIANDADFGLMYKDIADDKGTVKDRAGWYKVTSDFTVATNYEGYIHQNMAAFIGVFDGDGHTISAMKHRLFHGIGNGGVVRNVTLKGSVSVWGGILADSTAAGALVENVSAEVTLTDTRAYRDAYDGWAARPASGLVNIISGGTFKDVTVKTFIPADIHVSEAYDEATGGNQPITVDRLSAFGQLDGSGLANAKFENCTAYSNDDRLNFAAGAGEKNFAGTTDGELSEWTGKYTVNHYMPDENGEFKIFETENLEGIVGSTVTAVGKPPEGYILSAGYVGNVESGVLPIDGAAVVLSLYYVQDGLAVVTDDETEITFVLADDNKKSLQVSAVAELKGAPVTDAVIDWSSSDKDIATVDQNGNIAATGHGEAVIYATYRGVSLNFFVTVYDSYLSAEADIAAMYADAGYYDNWYLMTADIALTQNYREIAYKHTTQFSGVLDGGAEGHSISGVGTRLFYGLNGAMIRNVNVSASLVDSGGVFGWGIGGGSLLENVTVTATLNTTWNLHNALDMGRNYSAGAIASSIQNATFNNVSVYVDIADDINTQAYLGGVYPITAVSAFGDASNATVSFTDCHVYSNDLSIHFAKGQTGTVEGWYADMTVELYSYDMETGEYVFNKEVTQKGLRDKLSAATPVELEGFRYYADCELNVTEGVALADGSLVLKLYYVPANVSMEATSEQKVNLSLTSGQTNTVQCKLNVLLDDAPVTSGVVWASSDTNIVTVDENGNITAVAHGNAVVTAKYAGIVIEFEVTVYDAFITNDADFGTMFKDASHYTKWYLMTEDITLTTDYEADVIYSGETFTGVFNGGNHKLSGLTHRLFPSMSAGGIICNLSVENAVVDAWAGVFGELMAGGTIENVSVSVELSTTMANNNGNVWWTRAAGGLFNFISGGALKNVTVYATIPANINVATDSTGRTWQIAEMSAFGNAAGGTATFENCAAYSNHLDIKFALGVSAGQLIDSDGLVHNMLPAEIVETKNLSLADADGAKTVSLSVDADEVVWTSSDDKIATVENGVVTAVAHGEAIVTAAYNETETKFVVRVYDKFLASDADFGVMYNDAEYHTKWYLMTADVTLTTDYELKVIFSKVGFNGRFDGNGYAIVGLTHRLLPNMIAGGVICNLRVENAVMDCWAGVFGELMQNGTLENVSVSVKMTNTSANNDANLYIGRPASGLYNYIGGGILKNVTVFVNIPKDITVYTNSEGRTWQIAEMSAFGAVTAPAAATFENCLAYSNSTEIKFASGVAADKLLGTTKNEVKSWTLA